MAAITWTEQAGRRRVPAIEIPSHFNSTLAERDVKRFVDKNA